MKKKVFFYFFLINTFFLDAQNFDLLNIFSDAQIKLANTAINENYLTDEEKNIFLLLNLARMYPKLFTQIIVKYKGIVNYENDFLKNKKYVKSLLSELSIIKPAKALFPSKYLFELAQCHAINSGKRGKVGHNRIGCDLLSSDESECCAYGLEHAKDIVIQLLIDHQVKDLGHRRIMLDSNQINLGVSIQPHKNYKFNAVLNFSLKIIDE